MLLFCSKCEFLVKKIVRQLTIKKKIIIYNVRQLTKMKRGDFMKSHETLYKIRSLEKMIIRLFIDEKEFIPEQCNLKKQKIFPTPTQMQIIAYILKHKNEDIYQRDLENVLKLRRATVSGVLKTMEKNGFIIRITDKEDTRIKKIILNKNAEEIFEKGEKKLDELEKIVIKDISKTDLKIFSNVIDKMKENIENMSEGTESVCKKI